MCRRAAWHPPMGFGFRTAFPFLVRRERSSCATKVKRISFFVGAPDVVAGDFAGLSRWIFHFACGLFVLTTVRDTHEMTGRCAFSCAMQSGKGKALFAASLCKLIAEKLGCVR